MKILTLLWALLTFRPSVRLANETATQLIGLANEVAEGEWIQLTPMGDFRHSEGIQRIDAEAVRLMANSFSTLGQKLGRRFGGAPVFIGHPDVPAFAGPNPDKKAYGWVHELQGRGDGLYGRVEWSAPGKALLTEKHYRFHSPVFDGREIGVENGRKVYRPVAFVSAGLTNTPNLPVQPLPNEEQKENEMQLAALVALLRLANTATEQDVTTEITRLTTEAAKVTPLANEKTTLANEKATTDTTLANERTAHTTTKTTLDAVTKQRNRFALELAKKEGRILANEEADWDAKLTSDWEKNSKELASKAKVAKTESTLRGAGNRRVTLSNEADVQARRAKVQRLVNTEMAKGLIYDDAFRNVRLENEALFAEMQEPEKADEQG